MIRLTKKFRFETAHRLDKGYPEKCKNIHGHSWNGKIVVRTNSLDEYDMGVDYSDLKKILKPIEDELDHKLILWAGDMLVPELRDKTALILMEKNPTSEVIAEYIFNRVDRGIKRANLPCTLVSVQLDETCTTECVYTKE